MVRVAWYVMFALVVLSWGAMAWDYGNRQESRAMNILDCMSDVRYKFKVTPREAYDLCLEERR